MLARGVPRLFIVAIFVLVSLALLLASPFSGHAGRKSRDLISSVVQKVQNGEIGRLRVGGISETEEELAMREWEFRRAVQYEGTGARIQAFIDKARSGRPFTVSVIGGSVSKGRGLVPAKHPHEPRQVEIEQLDKDEADNGDASSGDTVELPPIMVEPPPTAEEKQDEEPERKPMPKFGADTLYSPENMHVLIFDWLNETFPHPENKMINGAQGGVGSGYFSWCFKEHISEESDLVLVELGINDLIQVDVLGSYEHLIRGVLELPNTPAVINVETFTTLFPTLLSSSALHLDVAAFYDIPSISVRDVLLPRLLGDPDTQMPRWFRTGPTVVMGDSKVREWGGIPVDLMHISALGHALAAGLVIRYLGEQIDKSKPAAGFGALGRLAPGALRQSDLRITELPAGALTMPFDPDTGLIRHDPTCRSMNSPQLHPTDNGEATEQQGIVLADSSHGWSNWAWKEKIYLKANQPGSLFSFPFTVVEPTPNLPPVEEEDGHLSDHEGRIGFEPLPLAMRPNAPYNVQPMGVIIDQLGRRRKRSTSKGAKGAKGMQRGHAARGKQAQTVPRRKRQYPDVEEIVDGARVMIGFQRSATLGLGSVFCWVDDERSEGRRVEGWWEIEERNMGMVEEVASGISPGSHTLHCELLEHTLDPTGGTEFRIFAIMHD